MSHKARRLCDESVYAREWVGRSSAFSRTLGEAYPLAGSAMMSDVSAWPLSPMNAEAVAEGALGAGPAGRVAMGSAWPAELVAEAADMSGSALSMVEGIEWMSAGEGWADDVEGLAAERTAAEQPMEMMRFLSHDLRAFLSNALSLVELQRTTAERLPLPAFLDSVTSQIESALSMADDLVQMARVEGGASLYKAVLLGDVAMEAVDRAWSLAAEKRIELSCDVPDDGAPVVGDHSLLTRALFNLIQNAIKYTPEGGRVGISIHHDGGRVVCRVEDTGIGIMEADLPYIFECYRRCDHRAFGEGMGLGLAFVKMVVDKHGGRIACRSLVGKGSVFTVELAAALEG